MRPPSPVREVALLLERDVGDARDRVAVGPAAATEHLGRRGHEGVQPERCARPLEPVDRSPGRMSSAISSASRVPGSVQRSRSVPIRSSEQAALTGEAQRVERRHGVARRRSRRRRPGRRGTPRRGGPGSHSRRAGTSPRAPGRTRPGRGRRARPMEGRAELLAEDRPRVVERVDVRVEPVASGRRAAPSARRCRCPSRTRPSRAGCRGLRPSGSGARIVVGVGLGRCWRRRPTRGRPG